MRTPINKSKTIKKIESITLTQTRDSIDSTDSLERIKNQNCDDETAKIDYKKVSNFKINCDIIKDKKDDELYWFAAYQELLDESLVKNIIKCSRDLIVKTMTIKDYGLVLGHSTKFPIYCWGILKQPFASLHCKLYLITFSELFLIFQYLISNNSSRDLFKQQMESLCKDDCINYTISSLEYDLKCLGFYHNSKMVSFHQSIYITDSQNTSLAEECKQILKMIKLINENQLQLGDKEKVLNYVLSSKGIKNDICKVKSCMADILREEIRETAKILSSLEVEGFKENIAKAMTQQTCYSSKVSKDMEVNVYNYNLDSGSNKDFILKHLKYGSNISNVNNNINITLINDTKVDELSGYSKNKVEIKPSSKPANLKSKDFQSKGMRSNIHIVTRNTVVDDESQEVSSICSIRDSLDFYQVTKSPEKSVLSSGILEKARATPQKTKRNFRYYV